MKVFRYFSSSLIERLSFSPEFYTQVERRLLNKGNFLKLDIKAGEGCGGFTYEFHSVHLPLEGSFLFAKKDTREKRESVLRSGRRIFAIY